MQLVEPYPEGDRGALRPADQERIDVLDTRIRSPEVRQLVEQRLDRDARLEPGERGVADADAEGEMTTGVARHVEDLGPRELPLVTVGRAEERHDDCLRTSSASRRTRRAPDG